MNNRAGIGSLLRAGPPPGRAGLSHLGRGEMVLPNRAMAMDPSLRQRAMQSMARQGRNPSQYTVGGQNSRNPMTGRPEFADMIYTENGWIDPATGAAPDYSGNDYANTGTYQAGAQQPAFVPPSFAPPPGDKLAGLDQRLAELSASIPSAGSDDPDSEYRPPAPVRPSMYSGGGAIAGMEALAPPAAQPDGQQQVYEESQQSTPDFGQFTTPQTFEQWRDTRNPSGKGVPNVLFGQTQQAGADSGFGGQQMLTPNVLGGQMPVANQQWGLPNTAMGMARENSANDPSILNSGYSDLSLSPSIYGGAFGGMPAAMGQAQAGIAFSGGNSNPYQPGRPNQGYGGNVGFGSAFGY